MITRSSPSAPLPFQGRRVVLGATFDVAAPPSVVIPQLCPVREREWIEGWDADMVYSHCGLIENNCVFTTENRQLGPAVYVTSRHEPENGIVELVVFFAGKLVLKLDIAATATQAGGTRLRWSRTYTGLSPEGNAALDGMTEESFRAQVATLARSLAAQCARQQAGRC